MIRDPAVGVNAPAPYPSLPDLDTRVSVARAARLDAEFLVDDLALSGLAPVAHPARDVDRSADLDALAYAAGRDEPAVTRHGWTSTRVA